MKVKDFVIENTGGGIYVAWGSFEDGTYFAIGSEDMFIYDEDEYAAMNESNYDGYGWELQHTIKSYPNYDGLNKEYLDVLQQLFDKTTDSYKYTIDLFGSVVND